MYIHVNPLSGSLASSIFDPLSALVGASGGVYALMGGYFMNAVVVSRFPVIVEGIYIYFLEKTIQTIYSSTQIKNVFFFL